MFSSIKIYGRFGRKRRNERGAAILLTFLMMIVLLGFSLAAGVHGHNSVVGAKEQLWDKQAFFIAEAGWQRARQALIDGTWSVGTGAGTTQTEDFDDPSDNKIGEYKVTMIDNEDNTYTIISEGYVPDQTNTVAKRKVTDSNLSVTSGSSNESLTATASASSSRGSNTPDKANDDSTSTRWQANTKGSGEWLAMNFGSATTLNQIIILEDNQINGVSIESSSDGSSWSVVAGLSVSESPSKTWTADFTSTSEQYFRAVLTASGANARVSVDEFRSFDTSSSTTTFGDGDFYSEW